LLNKSFAALALASCFCLSSAAFAQDAKVGVAQGFVSTQNGSVRLPGAEVIVKDSADHDVASLLTDGDGHFRTDPLPSGKYRIVASLSGFDAVASAVEIAAGKAIDVSIDLPIAKVAQTVTVVAATATVANEGTLASSDVIGGKELDEYTNGGGFQGALRLLASIIEVPGGVSIKGGRPSQASVQLGPSTLVNPTTGLTQVSLPDDAIDSVAVLPNPYAVEYGRFSSGLVIIQTRRAGDEWRLRLNNVDPTFRTKRGGSPVDVKGIGVFAPRVEMGGPILKDRLFLEQTAQYRYTASDVASRPEDELRTSKAFSSFTRLDANLSPRHSMVMMGGFFPSRSALDTLGTFTPPDATVDINARANRVSVMERALWTDSLFSETTIVGHDFQTHVAPQGTATMTLLPDTTLGNFFNQQHRYTGTYQLVSSVSGSRNALGGLHLFKFGIDVLRSHYEGTSLSRPVLIDRADGSLARRLDFAPFSAQLVRSTDAAFFVQDRYQPSTRWYLEFGGRLDRDGVASQFNVTPRVGTALLLNEAGTATIRGGFGLFFERTPSAAGAFDQFESATDTRFAPDGMTIAGAPLRYVHTTEDLQTPRSRTVDVAYDHRLNKTWSIHLGAIDRDGSHELMIDPIQTPASALLRLSSTGRSHYRELESGFHFTHQPTADVNVTYTYSRAEGDLNALSNYFDAVLWPVIGANAYARANADAPHRLLTRGRLMPTARWLFVGTFDWRSGLPYSITSDALDFVGPRNSLRFPTYARLELGIEHRITVFKLQPWIGVRAYNALDAFLPTDVQANLGSPAFGSFYNSEYRQFRLQVRFER
jgi:carboxypeptidase family protein/TonB-dependent receptor-like protein